MGIQDILGVMCVWKTQTYHNPNKIKECIYLIHDSEACAGFVGQGEGAHFVKHPLLSTGMKEVLLGREWKFLVLNNFKMQSGAISH